MIYKVPLQADKKRRGNEDEELTQNMNNKWLVVCAKFERNVSQSSSQCQTIVIRILQINFELAVK